MHLLLPTINRHARPTQRVGAVLLVALVLLLGVFHVLPEAHELIHPDAHDTEHTCAITLFSHGVPPLVHGLTSAIVVWLLIARIPFARAIFAKPPAYAHLPGRAPPAEAHTAEVH